MTPPIIWDMAHSIAHPQPKQYSGDYKTWSEARTLTTGYDTPLILEKVKNAALRVKHGEAAFERDSVNFDHIEYSWPVLAGLLWIASVNENTLSAIDIGGSLGSSYYQNKNFLSHVRPLTWSIVEQKHFVQFGNQHLADEHLKFYDDLKNCAAVVHPQVILLSSVLPYLEKPYDLLHTIKELRPQYIIVDRTPFFTGNTPDRITIQKSSPKVYDASYPARFLNERKFLRFFTSDYEIVADWKALAGDINLGKETATDKGFIFKIK